MKSSKSFKISKLIEKETNGSLDEVAVEDPLEIRVTYCNKNNEKVTKSLAITMRTPGNDIYLAIGFMVTEGLIDNRLQVENLKDLLSKDTIVRFDKGTIVNIVLDQATQVSEKCLERHFFSSSSCGVCGKKSIDNLYQTSSFKASNLKLPNKIFDVSYLEKLSKKMLEQQNLFQKSGGVHACGLFSFDGELHLVFEDVGRHNALDKLIGKLCIDDNLPAREFILVLSGRISFEMIQKAAMAGIGIVVAIGPPTSLAIEAAKKLKITLIGFLKKESCNLYVDSRE